MNNRVEYHREYRKNRRQWYRVLNREYEQRRREQLRKDVLNALGGCCKHCGFTDWRALQLDHINGGGRQERLSKGTNSFSSRDYKDILADPIKASHLQVLCANCNWIKRYVNKEATGAPQALNPPIG